MTTQKTDHDLLIEIHSAIHGRGGALDRLDALVESDRTIKALAYSAQEKAGQAQAVAGQALATAEDSRRRINRYTLASNGFVAIVGFVVMVVAWLRR